MSFNTLATQEVIDRTVAQLKTHHIDPIVVKTGAEALEKIKTLIPAQASVMNGSSRTLEQIGFVEYLKSGNHGWNNLHAGIVAEQDKAKQAYLRKQALLSDYYLGSVHALVEDGDLVIASNTGSQLPHIVFSSTNVVFVVGTQKIVPSFEIAMQRLHEYVMPLEDEHMQQKYGMGTFLSKLVVFKGENPMMGRKITVILVEEVLGF